MSKLVGRENRAAWAAVLLIGLLGCFGPAANLLGQNTSAALTGTVADSTGAVVPGASITLKNESSGDIRRTISNGEGYFTISAIQPGSYTATIEAKGFSRWEEKRLVFNSGDKRNLSDIALAVGSMNETVVVEAQALITPVDSGEISSVISTHELQNVSVVGSNAAEFIKILPGFAITGGTQNQASFTGEVHGTGAGPVGSFSANGQRTGALDITSDGAHIIDPGCNCGQAIDTNIDMTQELKVATSNFGADSQKGPIVISAVGKSGGSAFHGEGYLYARHNSLNANDALNNAQGFGANGQPLAPKPATKYFYPGGNIGGPVLLPFTRFNRNRDKLFFFFAYEYYNQTVDNGIYQAFVPTVDMRNGIFSQASIDAYRGSQPIGSQIQNAPNFPGGVVPSGSISPIGQKLINLYPLPNANPQTNGGFNYVQTSTKPQNAYQLRPRIDWSISDNTKLFVSYNRQRDTAYYTDTLWWRPTPTVPYPTRLIASNESDSVSANLTRVFSPSLTNEFVFTYTNLNLPNSFENPSKVDPAALGTAFKHIFGNNDIKQVPSITGWGNGFANLIQPSGFQLTGSLYAKKTLPTVADNLSKVWRTHTLKFGFYWEATSNNQPSNTNVNGQLIFATWGGNSTGNAYADLLTGHMAQYTETNKDVLYIMKYKPLEFYAQDSWKVSRRLTIEYGMRFSHFGPWVDQNGLGFAVFNPAAYSNNPADVNKLTGVEWHKINPSVPLSGAPSRALFLDPRFGLAWDIFGSGKTVLRGGWGIYRFHDEQNVQAAALGITQGSYSYTANNVTFDQIGQISAGFVAPGSITVLDRKDSEQPQTRSYSFTISQRIPWSSLFEASYVGNQSRFLSNWNNNFGQINDLQYGTLFKAGGVFTADNNYSPGTDTINSFRPFHNYQGIKVINHQMYSNYNSLQMSWNKQSGRINYLMNYTFSKSLGIRGEGGSPTGDPLTLTNNYGVLPNDRTHIFNVAYVISLPNVARNNALLKGAANGWQISGISQIQSGVNLQAAVSTNFGLSSTLPAGTVLPDGTVLSKNVGSSASLISGTPDINIQPVLVCDPRKNLGSNQFINAGCFAPPTPGHNGSFILPYLRGPAFFNNDISLFKNFALSESKKLQFRVSAYNFLNHPLTSFISGDNNLNLNFDATGKLSNSRFGYADWRIGHRIVQLAAKFYF